MNDLLNWIENEAARGLSEGDTVAALTAIKWRIKDSPPIAKTIGTEPQSARQPIETAPKDGTHILAWRTPIGIRTTNNTHPPTVVHWFDDPDEPGFYTSVNERAPEHPFEATHWMPLPHCQAESAPLISTDALSWLCHSGYLSVSDVEELTDDFKVTQPRRSQAALSRPLRPDEPAISSHHCQKQGE